MSGELPVSALRVVLVEPRNPLNIGAVARAMSNFGLCDLRLVNPYDVAFREARSAVRSRHILDSAQILQGVPEATADCGLVVGTTAGGARDLRLPLYRLEAAAELIRDAWQSQPVAILFGSEKFGLSNEQMSYCNWLLRIPTRSEHGSMNLGQAVAICLYELRREAGAAGQRFAPAPGLSAAESERITGLLQEILILSGYVQERTSVSGEQKLRRLVRRLGIPAADADTWSGILRQILWKVRSPANLPDVILKRDDEGADDV